MAGLKVKPVDPEPTPDVEPESGLPVPETKIEHYLKAIAENASLPSTEEASAGDVLSLDEDKKPAWAPASGGGGVLILTPPSHEVTISGGYNLIRLCAMEDVMSAVDMSTNARTKAIFINVPNVVSSDQSSWEYIHGFYALPNTILDPLAVYENWTVYIVPGDNDDFYLRYSSK